MKFPLFVYPNYWCNFHCSYCFTSSNKSRCKTTYVIENWENIVIDAKTSGITEFRLSGGEPTAPPHFNSMVEILANQRMPYTITTNGTYLKSQLSNLQGYPPYRIWLSYHPEHITMADLSKYAKLIKENINAELGLNLFLEDYRRFFNNLYSIKKMGVSHVKILQKTSIGRYSHNCSITPSQSEYRRICESADRYNIECRVEGLKSTDRGASTCILNERMLLSISPDGSAYPCCVVVGDKNSCIGSLKYKSISEIVYRYKKNEPMLYCHKLLPAINAEKEKCPLNLD